jgi:hypothetical protein
VCDHLRPMIAWCDPKPRQPGCTLYVFADTISVLRATAPTRRVGIDTRTPAARLRIVNRAGAACVANIVVCRRREQAHTQARIQFRYCRGMVVLHLYALSRGNPVCPWGGPRGPGRSLRRGCGGYDVCRRSRGCTYNIQLLAARGARSLS